MSDAKSKPAISIAIDRETINLYGVSFALRGFKDLSAADFSKGAVFELVQLRPDGPIFFRRFWRANPEPVGPIGKFLLQLCNGR